MAVQPGSSFGHYRVDSLIGRGGMGAVYLATDERLGRRVALKLLSSDLATQPSFRDRFIAESRTAASLDHPHIVPIFEAGEVDGQLFIAMRYVAGVDLGVLLSREGALPPPRAVRIVGQIADALDAAHTAGLIHRDVKPGNILIGTTSAGDDHAYLSDFGLTKHAGYGGPMTRTGQLVGTVDYVAPEQVEGRPIDSRVDVYSLACVLFEVLTGAPPFRRETDMAILFAHVQSPLPSAHQQRLEVPAALDGVLTRAAAKDPDQRYPTAGEFASAATAAVSETKPDNVRGAKAPITVPAKIQVSGGGRRLVVIGAVAMGAIAVLGYAAAAGFLAPRATIYANPSPTLVVAAGTEPPRTSAPVTPASPGVESPSPSPFVPFGTRIIFSRVPAPTDAGADVPVCDPFEPSGGKLYVANPDAPTVEPYRMTEVGTDLFESRPTWSANDNTILFEADGTLYVTTPAAEELREVARSESEFIGSYPAISPDGSRYAVAWFGRFDWPLWVGDTTGTAPATIVGNASDADQPTDPASFEWFRAAAWLPEGDLLALVSTSPREFAQAFRLERVIADGSEREVLPVNLSEQDSVASLLALSPDGAKLALDGDPFGAGRLLIVDLATGEVQQIDLATGAHSPAWSPDGTQLAYTDGPNVFRLDVTSGKSSQITHLDDAVACHLAWGDATADLVQPRPPLAAGTKPIERGELATGRYVFTKVTPNIELTVGEGWQADRNFVDGWQLWRAGLDPLPDDRPDIRTIVAARVQVGWVGPCFGDATTVLGDRPRDIIDWLAARDDLKVSPAVPVNVGGHTGLLADVTTRGPGCPEFQRRGVFLFGQDLYSVEAGDRTRVIVLDVDGVAVTIFVSSTESVFDAFMADAQPVIDSISFPAP